MRDFYIENVVEVVGRGKLRSDLRCDFLKIFVLNGEGIVRGIRVEERGRFKRLFC